MNHSWRRFGAVAALAGATFGVAAGAASAAPAGRGAAERAPDAGSPYKVCQIYELTGIYNAYEQEFYQGFTIGMRYATHGSDAVNGHPVQVSWNDDDDSATTAVTDFKSCVGAGDTIIGGTGDSGIADELAPLATQNKVIYISGAAAADNITGANRYTFRSGRQTYQDTVTGATYVAAAGKHQRIVVLGQDYAFGLSYLQDAKQVFKSLGDTVIPVMVPLTTADFTPVALQVKADHPNLIFLAWAGATAIPLSQALVQQGDFSHVKVVTGLAQIATYPIYGAIGTRFDYLSLYVYQGSTNAANEYLIKREQATYHTVPDLFAADGFVEAEMIAHALAAGGAPGNVDAMISSLEGWSFLAPKGMQTIRAADHAMLQPMFQVRLKRSGSSFVPTVLDTLSATQTAPPVAAHFAS